MFTEYLQLGFDHILDIEGYDHILYVLTLCAIYTYKSWKKIIVLVTAFTIGHCITLVLAGLGIISFPPKLIEMLIPITIILTGLSNIFQSKNQKINHKLVYSLPLLFGLIHGMGFSSFFRALLGRDQNIVSALLPFNIGVELGQLIIVFVAMILSYVWNKYLGLKHRYWNIVISSIAIIVAVKMLLERI